VRPPNHVPPPATRLNGEITSISIQDAVIGSGPVDAISVRYR
jgi:hypothetical protein